MSQETPGRRSMDDILFLGTDGEPEPLRISGRVPGKILETGRNGSAAKRRLDPSTRVLRSVGDLVRLERESRGGEFFPDPSILVQFTMQVASWCGRLGVGGAAGKG